MLTVKAHIPNSEDKLGLSILLTLGCDFRLGLGEGGGGPKLLASVSEVQGFRC